MNKKVKNIIFSLVFLLITVLYTILVLKVDVKPIGPNDSFVGFASVNNFFKNLLLFNGKIYKISEYLGYIAILYIGIYALIGFIELIKKKSLKKVDIEIYLLAVFYIIVLGTYFLFEKVVINFRPVLIDGVLEASYPSSHTILAICFCVSSIIINNLLFKKSKLAKVHNIFSILLMFAITITRFISGVHWFSDIIGGIIISCTLIQIFKTMLAFFSKKEIKCKFWKILVVILLFLGTCALSVFLEYKLFSSKQTIVRPFLNKDGIPYPEVTGGVRGELGIDKNVNEETIDKYLGRNDSVYRDMRMLEDPAKYESIGGNRFLNGYVDGFEIVPLPFIIPVGGLPKEVGETYQGNTLFSVDKNGEYQANYKESLSIIEELFPKDKYIFLMCGGGGYAGMMKKFLVSMGWDTDKIWVVGGYWYYDGENNIKVPEDEYDYYDFSSVPYHEIDFQKLTKFRDNKKGLVKLNKKYYDTTVNAEFDSLYETYWKEAEKIYKDEIANDDYISANNYVYEKEGKYIDLLLEKKDSFVLVFHDYVEDCSEELNLSDLALSVMENYNVFFYSVDPDIYKNTSLYEKYRYFPGIMIVKSGEVYKVADANDDLTKKIYKANDYDKEVKILSDWLVKYVSL